MGRPRKKSTTTTNKSKGRRKGAKSKFATIKRTSKRSSPPAQSSNQETSSISISEGSDHVNNVGVDHSSKLADHPIFVKNLRICSKDCECPPPVTWYVCKFCCRAFETPDGLRKHRRLSFKCHKRPKSKLSAQLDEEKEEVGRNANEKQDFDFEMLEDFDMEESQSISAPAGEPEDEISDGESSNASTVFVIRKPPKIAYGNGYDMTDNERPGPSADCRKYSVNSDNDNRHQRTIEMTC